ncbi:MAG: steroid 5-alpha reductase [Rickettsiales bacterium]|nr:steroid 5-alpha reductase [Rickettsiales bacterium]|tara:strand:- start:321 stop:944 length:624 start_codon:yes stop_codon:yes gene_type:complete
MKQKHFIDSHKGVTSVFVLLLMALYDHWDSPTSWIYFALHGGYGVMWVLKSATFPDKQWEQSCGIGYGVYILAGLSLYWITPWLIISKGIEAPAWALGLIVTIYALGVFFHFASDMQKHISLQLKPGLITDGLWARNRNPNYFGELLIYASFGLLAMEWMWVPLLVLSLFMVIIWIPNMLKKDRSLSRYPEFEDYKANSKLIIPYLI